VCNNTSWKEPLIIFWEVKVFTSEFKSIVHELGDGSLGKETGENVIQTAIFCEDLFAEYSNGIRIWECLGKNWHNGDQNTGQ